MGCFYYTCSVSNLHISSGDQVRFFLLTSNPYKNAHHASDIYDWWFPRTFPLKGKCDDYGLVEDFKDSLNKDIWLEGLKIDLIPQGTGENAFHDVPISKDMSFKDFLCALLEGRIIVKDNLTVSFALVREDVCQKLLKIETVNCYGEKINVDDLKKIVRKDYAEAIKLNTSLKIIKDWHMVGFKWTKDFENLFYKNTVPFTVGLSTNWRLVIEKNLPEEKVSEFLDTVAEFNYIQYVLTGVKHMWVPSHMSGQEFEFDKYHVYFQELSNVAKQCYEKGKKR